MSANHNGSIERAKELIEVAKQCGADAVKMQTYTAETMTIDAPGEEFKIVEGPWSGRTLHELYKWAETPFEWQKTLFEHARKVGITIFSTPFDETAVDLLEELGAPAYKIASFEIVDIPLIRYIAKTKKPLIMSTGMASDDEISVALDAARPLGLENITLLHCVSGYPVPYCEANLNRILYLRDKFEVNIGLSDHTMGTVSAVTSVALGASVIEKHFTLSRADGGPDSEFSLEPRELSELCSSTTEAWDALGIGRPARAESEKVSTQHRRSIYFVRDLAAGDVISNDSIARIRPGNGLPPKYFEELIGKRVSQNVNFGTPVSWSLIDDS